MQRHTRIRIAALGMGTLLAFGVVVAQDGPETPTSDELANDHPTPALRHFAPQKPAYEKPPVELPAPPLDPNGGFGGAAGAAVLGGGVPLGGFLAVPSGSGDAGVTRIDREVRAVIRRLG